MATSSANPFKLSRYSSDGLELVETLKTKANAVSDALDSLRTSSSRHVPSLGEADTTLSDLVGDWFHLDEFVGDVANGFFQANQHLLESPLTADQMDNLVLTMSDGTLMAQGEIGYADRDVAIAEAHELAEDMQYALDDGSISQEEMEALAARAARGQYDPAFSVTFAENMGPEGMAGIPFTIEAAWPDGDRGRNPGWGQQQLLPFAMILTTAMDTRAATEDIDRHDPDNQNLADEDRLSEDWVDEFTDFYQPDDTKYPSNLHYSLMVKYAELPTDVLVDIGNNQLGDMLARETTPSSYMNGMPWGIEDSTAEINILNAIGDNQDASLEWLGDQNESYTVNNMALVLEYNPTIGYATDNPLLGDALATVVDNGLQHWDDSKSDALFETTIDTVATEGEVHFRELVPVLGEGARTHMDQLAYRADEALPDQAGQTDDSTLQPLRNAHKFLEAIMENDEAANSVYLGSLEYVEDLLQGDTGEGLAGESRQIGSLMGLVTESDVSAAEEATNERIAARQSFLTGVGLVKDVVGLVPVAGQAASSAINISTTALGHVIDNFGMAGLEGELNQNYADIDEVRAGIRAEMSRATAVYEYGVNGAWTSDEVVQTVEDDPRYDTDRMDADFFVDDEEGDRRSIKPYEQMSDEEKAAYQVWLNSDAVNDVIGYDRTVAGQRMDEVIDSLEHN